MKYCVKILCQTTHSPKIYLTSWIYKQCWTSICTYLKHKTLIFLNSKTVISKTKIKYKKQGVSKRGEYCSLKNVKKNNAVYCKNRQHFKGTFIENHVCKKNAFYDIYENVTCINYFWRSGEHLMWYCKTKMLYEKKILRKRFKSNVNFIEDEYKIKLVVFHRPCHLLYKSLLKE